MTGSVADIFSLHLTVPFFNQLAQTKDIPHIQLTQIHVWFICSIWMEKEYPYTKNIQEVD